MKTPPCRECQRRAVGCRGTCEAWAAHEAAKPARYAATLQRQEQNHEIGDSLRRHARQEGRLGEIQRLKREGRG